MLNVTRNRFRNFPETRRPTAAPEGYLDPDALLEESETFERAFERLAYAESDNAMKNVHLDMAAVFRRASRDASRIWRDARG